MVWSSSKGIAFADVKEILVEILKDVRCDNWADRVAAVTPSTFHSLLGGMGSFTDLVICRENHHVITTDREPLANELVSCLSRIAYASSQEGPVAADAAVELCGTLSLVLSGWRCLECGHGQITSRGVKSLNAAVEVRRAIKEGIAQGTPSASLLTLWRTADNSKGFQELIGRARSSDIDYSDSDEWMRPCPVCGSNDTCVYRWKDEGNRFVPAGGNLPSRIRKATGNLNERYTTGPTKE